jgi:TonB family protein
MGFAKPGQIAVSRSFFEMVSRLSDGYAKLFRFEGARTDKNAREHQVYIVDAGVGAATPPEAASGLAGFLEDKLKVGSAAVLLLAVILAEGALLLRKQRAATTAVAAAPVTAPAAPVSKPEPAKPEPAKPEPKKPEPEPAKPAKAIESPPAKPEPVAKAPAAAPKTEPKPEPKRREDPPKPTEAFSPVQPNIVAVGSLNFPAEAAARGINSGQVKARLTIDAAGNVTRVQVLESRPARFFDVEAARSLREWKFDRGPANRTFVADIEFTNKR